MKKSILLLALFLWFRSNAQQVEEFSLIRETQFALNPATTGTRGFMYGTLAARKQFYKIKESPYTIFAGMHGQFERKTFGLGGWGLHDVTGPTGKTGAGLTFGYHIRFENDRKTPTTKESHLLSFGVGVSVVQYRFAGNKLLLDDPNDPELYTSRAYKIYPDASFGIWYQWKEHLWASFSVPQILGLNINYRGRDGQADIQRVQHINASVGGKYEPVKGKFSLDPIVAFRWVKNAPFQFDAGLRTNIMNLVYLGCNYRSEKRLVFEGGFMWKDYVNVSYAYDYDLRPYGPQIGGTHELAINFKINKRKVDK